nr:DNA-processing protein DprA [Roseomonas acroporae]
MDRLRLARTEGIGPRHYARLLERFGSAGRALAALPGHGDRFRIPPEGLVAREAEAVAKLGGRFLYLDDPDYPAALAATADPPPALAVLGDPRHLAARAVAVVGARNASAAGRRLAEELAAGLAREGLAVVSGLARGIDAAAHAATLAAGGVTVAAVAGGLDRPYPPENAALQRRIAEAGVVVAEAPLGTAPLARHFPRRNRIVAGLSLGVVVVEAALRSGSLITARMGLEAGREIFSVPGSPLDPRCRGSNDLIRQGAVLTETVEDVLRHLPAGPAAPPFGTAPSATAPLATAPAGPRPGRPRPDAAPGGAAQDGSAGAAGPAGGEAQVLELLGPTPMAVDELLRRCHLSAGALQAVLLDLELAGRIETLPGNRVCLLSARAD